MATLAFFATGWVDTKPNGEPTAAFFWKREEQVRKVVATIYVPMRYESTRGRNLNLIIVI